MPPGVGYGFAPPMPSTAPLDALPTFAPPPTTPQVPTFLREEGPAAFYQRPDGSEFAIPSAIARKYRPQDFAQAASPAAGEILAPPPVLTSPQGPGQGDASPDAVPLGLPPQQLPEPTPQVQAPRQRKPRDAFEAADMHAMSGLDMREQAAQQQSEAEQKQAQEEAAALQAREAKLQEIEAARQKQVADEQKKLADLTADTDRAVEAYSNAKIDQNRLYHSMSTGKKVLAGISIALSGLGKAFKGESGNTALDLILKAFDDDVKLQMAAIDKMGQTVQLKRGQVDQFLKTMGSTEAAYNAQMAGYLARTQRQIEMIAAKTKDEKVKANALDLQGQIAEKRAEYLNAAGQARFGREMQQEQLAEQKRANRAQEANARASLDLRREELEEQKAARAAKLAAQGKAKEAELVRENGVVLPGGGGIILARRPEEAGKITEKLTAAEQMVNIIDRITAAREEHGKEGFGDWLKSEEGKRMTSDWGYLFMQNKNYFDLGAIQGADEKLIERLQGDDPAAAWRSTAPILDQLRKNVVQGTNLTIRNNDTSGMLPKDYRWDPKPPGPPTETPEGKIAGQVASRAPDAGASGYRETIIRGAEQRGMSRAEAEQYAEKRIRSATPWKANLDRIAGEIAGAEGKERERKILALKATAQKERGERKAEIERVIQAIEAGQVRAPVF